MNSDKIQRLLYVLFLMLGCVFFISSCDDAESTKIDLTKRKWYTESTDAFLYGKNDINLSVQTDRAWLYFLSDGTGIMSCRTTDKDTFFGTSRNETAFRFNYTVSGNKVRLSFKDSMDNRMLTYIGDYLVDEESSTRYKGLSFTSSDLEHAKELADEQEFQLSINHNAFQSLDVFIGFGNNLQPVKFTSYYTWSVSFSCHMPKDSQRRGVTSAGLVIYVDNGTITNKTGYDKDDECTVSVTTLDGKKAYYFEHSVYYNDDTQCGASMNVRSDSGSSLIIHSAYRYYDSVSKKYFTSPSKEYVLTGEGIDISEEEDNPNGNTSGGSNTGGGNNDSGDIGHAPVGNAVDLGLSVKWADRNIGATNVENCGKYYAWGEIKTKGTYSLNSYFDSSYSKYSFGNTIKPEDDIAHVTWGGKWRIPTFDEIYELYTKCTIEWEYSKQGWNITSKINGNTIFLPAAGYYGDYGLILKGTWGCYWSSSTTSSRYEEAYILALNSATWSPITFERFRGVPVRPVCSI